MVLLETVQGAFISQQFGIPSSSVASREPAMWSLGRKAAWQEFPGSQFHQHFHPGIDRAAAFGTPVRAMEDGICRSSGFLNEIDGIRVEIEIRPGTRYAVNHLSSRLVIATQRVTRGQMIGRVGCTGSCTGNHTHEGVSIFEPDAAGVFRTFLYDPALFTNGGPLANDPRIQPLIQKLRVKGSGVNIRFHPPDSSNSGNIFATARDHGIYRRLNGDRLSNLRYQFRFLHWTTTEDGTWAVVMGYRRKLAIRKSMVRFVNE